MSAAECRSVGMPAPSTGMAVSVTRDNTHRITLQRRAAFPRHVLGEKANASLTYRSREDRYHKSRCCLLVGEMSFWMAIYYTSCACNPTRNRASRVCTYTAVSLGREADRQGSQALCTAAGAGDTKICVLGTSIGVAEGGASCRCDPFRGGSLFTPVLSSIGRRCVVPPRNTTPHCAG